MKGFKNMDKGALTPLDMKSTKYKLLYAVLTLFMAITCLIVIVPVLWLALAGFKEPQELYAIPTTFFPKQIRLSKLMECWQQMKYYKYYINTFVMAGGCVVVNFIVSGISAYVFSRLKPAGSGALYKFSLILMMLPATATTVTAYMLYKNVPVLHINLLNTYWPLWLGGFNLFDMFLLKNFFDGISISLIEAAKIDGASSTKIFLKIIVPLSIPIFVVVGVTTFNSQMGSFLWPYLVLKDREKFVLGIHIYNLKSSGYTMDKQMMALLFAVIPQVIIFALFQKYIIGGINVGGVKG